jgi:predicted DNA-binding ribbon-helix-helix protein
MVGASKKSSVVKRSVVVDGHKTSVSLEDQFWAELKAIGEQKKIPMSELITEIDRDRQGSNLSSALRVFILSYHRPHQDLMIPASRGAGEKIKGLSPFKDLGSLSPLAVAKSTEFYSRVDRTVAERHCPQLHLNVRRS